MSKGKKIQKRSSRKKKVSLGVKISRFFRKIIYSFMKTILGFMDWLTSSIRNTIIIITVIAVALVGTFLITHNSSNIEKMSTTYLDNVEKSVIKENTGRKFEETYEMSDYLIYGESFQFFKKRYSQAGDDTRGKNVVFRNVETEKEYTYTFDDGADTGVKLGQLEEGLYEVYIFNHFQKERVFSKKAIKGDTFTTMRRNGKVMNIQIQCDKDYLKDFGINYKKNYLFVTVTENTPITTTLDVMIDPCGLNTHALTNKEVEHFSNDKIDEANASYQLAKMIKEDLEVYGLKVGLTRDKDERIGYYGEDSRAGKAFESKAKVFLSLGMCENEKVTRPNIVTSAYSTGVNANYLCYASQDLGVELTALSTRPEFEPGVSYDMFTTDENFEYTHWEFYPQLRETGGKATFTGTIEFATKNKKYSDAYGMCGFMYFFASATNDESTDYFLNNKELIAQSIADG
ncbi:MAG: hypothetical protein KBT48_05200, partial [Firmicutes bacterium]|nr:hypothetical protein [Bacillota bacterium]